MYKQQQVFQSYMHLIKNLPFPQTLSLCVQTSEVDLVAASTTTLRLSPQPHISVLLTLPRVRGFLELFLSIPKVRKLMEDTNRENNQPFAAYTPGDHHVCVPR